MIHAAVFLVAVIVVVGLFLGGVFTAIGWCFQLFRIIGIAIGRLVRRPVLLAPFAAVLLFAAVLILTR